jgi:hypothetical protein
MTQFVALPIPKTLSVVSEIYVHHLIAQGCRVEEANTSMQPKVLAKHVLMDIGVLVLLNAARVNIVMEVNANQFRLCDLRLINGILMTIEFISVLKGSIATAGSFKNAHRPMPTMGFADLAWASIRLRQANIAVFVPKIMS